MYGPKNVGRVLGSQIYVYPTFEDIPSTIPLSHNDFFVNQTTGQVYSYAVDERGVGEWVYKFAIPNNDLLVSNEQRIAAVEEYFLNGAAKRAISDDQGNGIRATYETKEGSAAKLAQVVDGDVTAKKAERDAEGNVITSEYPHRGRQNTFSEKNTFTQGVAMGHGSDVEIFNGFVFSNGKLFLKVGTAPGRYTYYQVPFCHDDSFVHDEATHTLATTDQMEAAKQEAIGSSNDYALDLIEALRRNFTGTQAQFETLSANVFHVVKFIAETTETINSRVQTRFFEFLFSQPVTLLGYVGFIVNRNAPYDFFFGMHDDTFVMGDCAVQRDDDGNAIGITMPSELPMAGRDHSENFVDGNLVKAVKENDSVTLKDAGVNPVQMAQAEALRVSNETARQANEGTRLSQEASRVAAELERFRVHPKPITYAQFLHLRDDGWYINLLADGSQTVTETQPESYVYSFQYQSDAVYEPVDDEEAAEMFETCSEAKEYLANQMDVTPEQYAELEQQGLIDPDVRYYVEDNELYELLTVTIPAQEQSREAAEAQRVSAEETRQDNLEEDIKNYPYGITQAQFDLLDNGGVFGVHFNEQGVKVVTVYATQAAAVAANETYIFPMVAGLDYPAEGIGGDSPYLNIPPLPQEDGDYVLKGHVASGVGGYAWEADE